MTDPQWGFLTSRTFPQLQPLHCAPPPLPPVQISLVPDKNGQIRKRDSARSSIIVSFFCRYFQPLHRAFPALPVTQSALAVAESRSSKVFVNLLSAADGFSHTKLSFQPLSLCPAIQSDWLWSFQPLQCAFPALPATQSELAEWRSPDLVWSLSIFCNCSWWVFTSHIQNFPFSPFHCSTYCVIELPAIQSDWLWCYIGKSNHLNGIEKDLCHSHS